MDDVQMGVVSTGSTQRLRAGWACPCGGFWVSAGVSVGKNRPRMKTTMTNRRCANGSGFDRLNPTASDWAGLSTSTLPAVAVQRLGGLWVSAGVSVGGSTDSVTDSRTGTDGRRANGSRFGLGGLVPAADSGFRGARRWGKPSTNSFHE